jgi:tungstate transport system substrate-binding protein
MYNDFVTIGPSDDPAKIKGITTASEAFKRLAKSGQSFLASFGSF